MPCWDRQYVFMFIIILVIKIIEQEWNVVKGRNLCPTRVRPLSDL